MAGSRSLGSLTLDLILKLGGFKEGINSSERELERLNKKAIAVGRGIGIAISAGIGLAISGFTALVVGIKSSINAMDEISKAAQKVGASTEDFSKLAYAGGLADVSIGQLETSLGLLVKSQADSLKGTNDQARIFKALGIAVQDSEGHLRSSIDVLKDFADRFQALKGSPEAIAAGLKIFGRGFQEIIPLIKDGSQGINEAGIELEKFGGVITTEAGRNAEAFNDNLKRLKTQFGAIFSTMATDLLPALKEGSTDLAAIAKNGELAANAASLIGTAMRFVLGAINSYNYSVKQASIEIEAFINIASGLNQITENLITFGFANGTVKEGVDKVSGSFTEAKDALSDLQKQSEKPVKLIFAGVDADPAGLFKKSVAEVAAEGKAKELQDKLNAALAGPVKTPSIGRSSGGSRSSGKSDAQREAEQLQASFDRMVASLNEQIALTGDVSAVEKLRYDLANGELAKLDPAKKQELLQLQQSAQFRQDDYDAEQKQIQAEEDHNAAVKAGIDQTDGQIKDMQFELGLLAVTDKERERAIALRYADANATQAQRDEIGKLSDSLYEMSQNKQLLDDLKSGLSDMFVDFVSGAKSAKDAFGDFADAIYKRALQFVADKAIQALFDGFSKTGTSSTGSTGGFLSSLVGLFGGQRAMGGPVKSGQLYEVGEYNRPETFFSGGKQFLIPGNQGMVSPSGGISQSNNFYFAAPTSMKTQEQLAARVGTRATEAIRRNN